MAWRETRGAWRHFVFFFISIALGVSALVAVALFASNLQGAIQREARNLMAADIEVRATRPLTPEARAVLEELKPKGINHMQVSELIAMAAAGGRTQLVELKAVERGYPFYGSLRTEPDGALALLFAGPNVLVEESLLIRLNKKIGEMVKIGQAELRIAGILRKEPDRAAGAFSLGPRALISQDALRATRLVQPGSRITNRYLLKLPDWVDAERFQVELAQRFSDKTVRVRHYQDAQPMLRRFLRQLTMYLGLVGIIALMVGGVGVATNIRAFLKEKIQTIAVLKVLGATPRHILQIYLLQTVLMGLLASCAGALVGAGLQFVLPPLLRQWLTVEPEFHLLPMPVVRGILMGVLTTTLFALWPLLEARRLRPNIIFRKDVASVSSQSPTAAVWVAIGAVACALAALALWEADSWRVAGLFIGALVVAFGVLHVTASAMIRGARRLPRFHSLMWRQAVSNLHRPGSQARTVVVSLGIGVMVILALHLVERNLLWEIGENVPKDAPSYFFIDIQPDQQQAFAGLLAQHGQQDVQLTPLVRSRLSAINSEVIQPEGREKQEHGWYFTREYVLTFQRDLPKGNVLLKGQWWGGERDARRDPAELKVSVEEEAAHHLGLDLGSSVTFDIQGTVVKATVTSLRKVDWGNLSTNFYFIFQPGALDGAPMTYVATAHVAPAEEVALQQAVVAAFPNVSAINIRDILDSVRRVMDRISLVIRLMAILAIGAGLIVLAGSLAATRYQRIYDAMILKSLGARRRTLAAMFLAEYSLLGGAAGLVGALLATLLSWGAVYWIFDLSWLFQPIATAFGIVATVVITVSVGVLSTFRILGLKPLPVLRQE